MKKLSALFVFALFLASQVCAQKLIKTDRDHDGLKGHVQKVTTETARLSKVDGKEAESARELSEVTIYDAAGDRTRRESYYKGRLSETNVYSYLDGERVVRTEFFGNQGSTAAPSASGDTRYSIKVKYKYDPQGHRIEATRFRNDGTQASRSVMIYDAKGNKIEERSYRANGSQVRKFTYTYDAHGNVAEESYDFEGDQFDFRYSYTYELDAQGNWTKSITSKWVTKEGKSFFEPSLVSYRVITYF